MNFDDKYFDNYGGPGTDYSQYFRKGSSSFRYVKDSVLGLCKPKTVYDIGCAYGDLLAFLDRQFHFDFLMGCDINKAACSRAQGLLGSKAKIYHTDVLKKNFRIPDQTPDFVIANILMYVPDNKVDIFFFNLHRLCSSFTLVCLLCIYDLYDGYWFVSEDGKVHNQENETDSDPYRVVNRPKQWWLYLFNKFNFKVVYEDKNGLFYLRKSDSFTKTFPFPIHFLSPRWENENTVIEGDEE